MLNNYKNDKFLEFLKNLIEIPIEKYAAILREESEEYENLVRSNDILGFLHEYQGIISNNVYLMSEFQEIAQNLIQILRINSLLKQKESLLREKEISAHYKKSSNIQAIMDLIKKLNDSIAKNRTKLEFLEEDYFQRKEQVEEIQKEIDDYNRKIVALNKEKKNCFSEINKITRSMSENTDFTRNKVINNEIDSQDNLSNAERIKNFQMRAKEFQFQINTIRKKQSKSQQILSELIPTYEIYEKDYLDIQEMVNTEEKKIKDLQSELEETVKDDENLDIKDYKLTGINSIRSLSEINENLKLLDEEINQIVITDDYYDSNNPQDLSLIIKKLSEFDQKLANNNPEITITTKEEQINESLEEFRRLEESLNKIEKQSNIFLETINLKSRFRITISENSDNFFIYIEFVRKELDYINFEDLTTPEKIFFIIVFYLSVKIFFNKHNIIFSNFSIINRYNKAGSIYRTIRKILPIFNTEEELAHYNIIFIFSNLELKNEIKNLKSIIIKES
ncbi:MAG: hypothetical protein ACFE9Z_14460 [Promethearchaeota archaeon]